MAIHSKILVHWTGAKDIEKERLSKAERLQKYIERLTDWYDDGLFAKRTTEDLIRYPAQKGKVRKWKMKRLVRICFTEVRLSQVKTHAKRYGELGIGFTRNFIINKGGRPVIYIPYAPKPDGRLLEESIKTLLEKSANNEDINRSKKWILAHIKQMSNGLPEDHKDFEDYYEEMEWRLVYDEKPNNRHFIEGAGDGVYRVRFEAGDIKVIIFPDEDVKQKALQDGTLAGYFAKHRPIMATLDDCGNF